MTTLAAIQGAPDRVLKAVADLGIETNYPIPITVGSEHELVLRRIAKLGFQYQVLRGQDGTRPTSHAAGVTITTGWGGGGSISATDGVTTVSPATSIRFPVGTLSDEGAGVAGVTLIPTLFSLSVDYQTAGMDPSDPATGYPVLADIPIGAIVLKAWVIVRQAYQATPDPGPIRIAIIARSGASNETNQNYTAAVGANEVDFNFANDYPTTAGSEQNDIDTYPFSSGAFPTASKLLACYDSDITADLTAGAADLYAIIAAPAS